MRMRKDSVPIDPRMGKSHDPTCSAPRLRMDNTSARSDGRPPSGGGVKHGSQGTIDTYSNMQVNLPEIPTHAADLDPCRQSDSIDLIEDI